MRKEQVGRAEEPARSSPGASSSVGRWFVAQTGKFNTMQWVTVSQVVPKKQSYHLFLMSTWCCSTSRMEGTGLQEEINSRM